VRGGQGSERGWGVVELERLGHRDYQVVVLGEFQDPAACRGPEGAARGVGGAGEDVAFGPCPGRGGDGDHPPAERWLPGR